MGRKIAKVAVARAVYAIDKPYDYLVPLELEGRLEPGMRVLVPFAAGNRGSDGLVLSLYEAPSAGESLKLIQAVLDDQPVLDEKAVQLALWMRERCFCTVYDCVKAMLPAGLYFSLRDQVAVLADGTVVPCCLDHEGDVPLGNLLTQELEEILDSPRARGIYEGFSRGKPSGKKLVES